MTDVYRNTQKINIYMIYKTNDIILEADLLNKTFVDFLS